MSAKYPPAGNEPSPPQRQRTTSFSVFAADPGEQSIPACFERQVDISREDLAVSSRKLTLTYGELNERANRIALAILNERGAEPEPVALLLENDVAAIEAILGILKTGKFYVPLDTSLPPSRLAYMLRDSQAALVLTNTRNIELARELSETSIASIDLDSLAPGSAQGNCGIATQPDAAAWIIYTSGSTGQPKGVVQSHRNVIQFVRNYRVGLGLSSSDRLSLLFSFGANAAAHELFSALLNGASVHLFDMRKEEATELASWLAAHKVTLYSSVPTVFRYFCQTLSGTLAFPDLRYIKLVGEPVTKRDVELYRKHFSDVVLINRFGTTETGTVCWHFIDKETPIEGSLVPVGYPVAGNTVLLLDDDQNTVPQGETGEIAVESRYLSPGYWNKPEHTRKAFLTAAQGADTRIYLTGDLGRILPDGRLLHVGRKDFQVKIRGFRIETAEVEMALLTVSEAKEAVVMARDDPRGESHLVAYLLAPSRPRMLAGNLRQALAKILPEYMIPARFVILDRFPLAPNGKINRRELPLPDWSRPEIDSPFVAPRTESEQCMARIWGEILGVDRVGVHDDFFELGGHSLAAAQIVSRVAEEFHSEIPVSLLLDAPTVAQMAQRVDGGSSLSTSSIPIVEIQNADSIPLSLMQQQLWFLDQFAPGVPLYNVARAFRLKGPVVVSALENSLNEIVRRHEILRTTFPAIEGSPVQRVASLAKCVVPLVDLTDIQEQGLQEKIMLMGGEEARQPFDLATGPLLRFRLLKLNEQEHVFLMTMHHIVTDGWSLGVFLMELSSLYEAFSNGKSSPLQELPIQYADFAYWQRQRLQHESSDQHLAYWAKQLAGVPLLDLPADRSRPAKRTFQSAAESMTLSKDFRQRLQLLCQSEGVTLFMSLLAAINALLFRWTGQHDLVVGSVIAGRNRPELEGLIGPFIHTLVLRTDLSGDPSFRELLGRVRDVAFDAYANPEVPFDKLLEQSPMDRGFSRGTLFQVLFVFQQWTSQHELKLPGIQVREFPVETAALDNDLFISITETDEKLNCRFTYRTDLFEASTIRRMLQQLETLLGGAVANPDLRLWELPILREAELQEILIGWNDTRSDYPAHKCVHELFEEQVARTPESTAIVFEGQQLSYRELDQRSNQLASYLQTSGVHAGVLTGILLDRSPEMIVAVLGVLKAGGAYVPLDPSWPEKRLERILDEIAPPVLLSQQRFSKLSTRNETVVLRLDSDWKIIAGQPRNKPAVQVTPDDLAYVIYTSGSTGQPKGVEITHQALVNFAASTCSTFQLKPTDRILQFTTLSFDTAAEEIFPTLISGATLVLRSDSMLDTPEHFIEQCGVQKISVLGLPTAYWHELAEKLSPESPLPMPLRLVVIGGEKIIPERLAQWRRIAAGRVRLLNRYGPTEATVSVTTQELDRSPENENGPSPMPLGRREVPIGRPISNVQLYILDAHLNPVPAGVCGELCIAGVALAKGYYKRPEVTPKKFVPNPFSKVPGDRLYKTGDQARYLSDGTIELAGRLDHQIKIRGFRVELEEIEAALHAHPMTRQAVVVALNGSNGDQRLVAYLTVVPGSTLAGDELRTFLKNRLPAYMVPSTFVFLDALPLTSNGKIDRHALPEPHEKESTQRTDFVAPRTDVERQLAADWEAVLGTAPIGVRADFFDLGGHSLVAVRLISRIDKRFGKRLPLAALFEAPTIEQLAVVLQQKDPHSQNSLPTDRGSIPRRGSHQPVPLSFAQRRLWFLYRLEPGRSVYNVPIALRIRGTLDPLALKQALDFVVLRHEALRTTIAVVDGQPQQIVQNPAPIQLPILDLLLEDNERREAEARRWCEEEARSPFDISVGPLMRARMLKLSSEDWVFLLTMHHIICDAWSVETLFRELETFYADFTSNRMPSLADLPIQYGDFAAWQCDQIHGAAMKSHLDFWEEHLRDVPPFLNLPADWPRPPVQTYRGATCSFPLPPALPDALLALCRQEQVTLFMAMLAAFTVLLHRYSDQDDIVVGSPVANRNAHELEPLIGFFVNTLALRTKVSSNPTFRQLLRQVRTAVLEADAHQDLPFEKLVEELRPQRDNSRSPLFQVMFALNGPAKDLTLPGLTISRFPIESDCAKFDLTLFIHEEPGQLRCSIEFNTDLFAPSTIQRMGRHYETILEAVTADPDRSAGLLPVLPPAERHEVLLQLNQTLSEYPHDASIHELFERQAARSPRALAAVSTNVSLTYDVLNRRANRMAHLLHVRGVQPGARVCVYLENPAEIVTAWLGVLKAGGAYVPLDTSYPVERLAFMIKDSSASAIITLGTLQSLLPQTGAIVLALDTDHDELAGMSEIDCAIRTDANSPAYVIYTSGSSGTPKGVVIPHRAVNRLVLNTNYIRVTTADVVAQISNCSFDAATFEVWGALLNGARLAVIPKEVLLSPGDFATQIREQGVTVMFLTTALFNEMARSVPTAFAKLRYLLFGGETVKPHWVAEVLKHGPPENLLHVYGPTESTTFATWHRVQSVPKDAATVPIGRPVANTTVYLFDRYLQPVPIGVPGEIYVGGDGLALEYLNQPALTEQKFVRSPLPEHSGTRLYRTGDLARLRPDGDIEFIRRMDHQVKIRGFLVEPEEIEAVLEQHPAVLKAAVLAGLDVTGNQCLTGYFAVGAGAVPSAADLRAFLKAKLPEYMVPSLFVMLSDIPLTSNGKVDRAALRSRDDSALAVEEYPVAPRDALESILVKLWESLLPAQPIGIQDNFFDLGGHSLLAAHLVSRIEKATGEHLALSIFFQGPTIEQLASVIRNRAGKPSSPSIAALHPFGFRPPLFWVYGDHSNVVLQRLLPADQPLYAFVHQCQDGKPAAYSTVEAIAAAYLRDVRAIQPKGPHYLGGFSFGGLVAYAMARQLAQEGECPALVALLDPTWQETGKPSEPADVSDVEQGEAARHQTIRAWSKRHLGQLDKLDPKAKLAYIWTRIDNLLNKHIEQCKKNIRRVQYRFYLAAGRPIPVHLRSTYLVDLYTKAARHYLPVTFSGRVVLFLGTDSRAKRRKYWRKLVGENLEIQELPGSHIELVRGIQVQEFAGKLKRCLEGVQHDIASRDDGHHLVTHASEKER